MAHGLGAVMRARIPTHELHLIGMHAKGFGDDARLSMYATRTTGHQHMGEGIRLHENRTARGIRAVQYRLWPLPQIRMELDQRSSSMGRTMVMCGNRSGQQDQEQERIRADHGGR